MASSKVDKLHIANWRRRQAEGAIDNQFSSWISGLQARQIWLTNVDRILHFFGGFFTSVLIGVVCAKWGTRIQRKKKIAH